MPATNESIEVYLEKFIIPSKIHSGGIDYHNRFSASFYIFSGFCLDTLEYYKDSFNRPYIWILSYYSIIVGIFILIK